MIGLSVSFVHSIFDGIFLNLHFRPFGGAALFGGLVLVKLFADGGGAFLVAKFAENESCPAIARHDVVVARDGASAFSALRHLNQPPFRFFLSLPALP